jgi:hypothetical protein
MRSAVACLAVLFVASPVWAEVTTIERTSSESLIDFPVAPLQMNMYGGHGTSFHTAYGPQAATGLVWTLDETSPDWQIIENLFTTPAVGHYFSHWGLSWGYTGSVGMRVIGGNGGGRFDDLHSISVTVEHYSSSLFRGTLRVTGEGYHEDVRVPEPTSVVLLLISLAVATLPRNRRVT